MTSHYQTGLDLPVGMVFPLLASLRFRWVTWCGATICKQKIRRATACKKVVWYNYVEQNDIQNNSLQKENEFVIQFPKKGTKCEKWWCMKLTLAACKNKWSNLQKYDRKWKLTTKDYSKQVLTTKLIPYNNLQEIIQSNNWQKVNTNIFR